MQKNYIASAFLTIENSQVLVLHDCKQKKTQVIENKDWLTILEIFIHEQSVEAAYHRFQKIQAFPVLESMQQCIKAHNIPDSFIVFVTHKVLRVFKKGDYSLLMIPEEPVDLTKLMCI
ncbi:MULTISPECIES: hypothetical protein [unclassified Nostoc]|uniref:hypothetical protein n=1 Tax=unclassified Nostoc TaxID=2593658 RepID=UPI000B953509|nr:hypothetical protein [Nostoc sp. 'Peltigera membranacea cyanobiont' 232]OYD99789.1 hypothetical protein CDG79_38875 [Nostoc sp. 'Peltigera membranacea cyanobiont' 232]